MITNKEMDKAVDQILHEIVPENQLELPFTRNLYIYERNDDDYECTAVIYADTEEIAERVLIEKLDNKETIKYYELMKTIPALLHDINKATCIAYQATYVGY